MTTQSDGSQKQPIVAQAIALQASPVQQNPQNQEGEKAAVSENHVLIKQEPSELHQEFVEPIEGVEEIANPVVVKQNQQQVNQKLNELLETVSDHSPLLIYL